MFNLNVLCIDNSFENCYFDYKKMISNDFFHRNYILEEISLIMQQFSKSNMNYKA